MSLTTQIAKSLFVRNGQFGTPLLNDDPNSFHIYEPGSKWPSKHKSWNSLASNQNEFWVSKAVSWQNNLEEKSPLTYSYLLANFKDNNIMDNLDTL